MPNKSNKEFDLMTRKNLALSYAKKYQKATSKKQKSGVGEILCKGRI